jgi:hypothetical protein
MIVMDRIETLIYLEKKMLNNERLIVPRYNDGEYLLMNNTEKIIANSKSGYLSELLRKSIKIKGQFICVNFLKSHNIELKDKWYDTQNYLIKESNCDLYGCSNYNVYDFCNDSSLLIKQFHGKVLLVSGLSDKANLFFKKIKPDLEYYQTPMSEAVLKYNEIKNDLFENSQLYDTILFSCGPLAKVLIADLIDKCSCNLIDLGSILNAILNLTDQWTMSWTKEINIEEKIKMFKNKLEKYL